MTDRPIDRVGATGQVQVQYVDCDIHWRLDPAEIVDLLPEPWRSRRAISRIIHSAPVFTPYQDASRVDAKPANGIAGSDPALLNRQLFVEGGVDLAINIPSGTGYSPTLDPDLYAALCSAINDWQAESWLGRDNPYGRLKSSISIPVNNVPMAVREIEKWAGHPHFVQVFLPAIALTPYGSPYFDPIWEAASRHGLPVAMHVNRGGWDMHLTPVGYLQRYPEYNAIGYAVTYAAQLTSFVCQGTFAKFPDLRLVMVEGGFSWIGPLMSMLDRNWERLGSETPRVTRRPSEYVREHVRFTSQPVEEPEETKELLRLYEWGEAAELLMFSTDYPHWDYDHPGRAISLRLPEGARRRIYAENAINFYGFAATRPIDELDRQAAVRAAETERLDQERLARRPA